MIDPPEPLAVELGEGVPFLPCLSALQSGPLEEADVLAFGVGLERSQKARGRFAGLGLQLARQAPGLLRLRSP